MIFSCIHCFESFGFKSKEKFFSYFPLCPVCHQILRSFYHPVINPKEISFQNLDGFISFYLSTPQSMSLLKVWKTHGGYFLNRLIFSPLQKDTQTWINQSLGVLLPLPLEAHRYHELRHHPALTIAKTLRNLCHLPLDISVLNISSLNFQKKQSEKNFFERLTSADRIQISQYKLPKKVLIVDDFLTTGMTLDRLANRLKTLGVSQVFGLTLSYRLSVACNTAEPGPYPSVKK